MGIGVCLGSTKQIERNRVVRRKPPERNAVAIDEFRDAQERLRGRRSDQGKRVISGMHEGFASQGERGDQHIAEQRNRRDCDPHLVGRHDQDLAALLDHAAGKRNLPGQQAELADKLPWLGHENGAVDAVRVVDDANLTREHDNQRRPRIPRGIEHFAILGRARFTEATQHLDLFRRQRGDECGRCRYSEKAVDMFGAPVE